MSSLSHVDDDAVNLQTPAKEASRTRLGMGDTMRLSLVMGWIVWGAAYAYWRELATPRIFAAGGAQVYLTDLLIVGTVALGILDLLGMLFDGEHSAAEQFVALLIGAYCVYTLSVVWIGEILLGFTPVESTRAIAARFVVLLVPLVIGLLRRNPQLEAPILTAPAVVAIPVVIGGAFNAITGAYVISVDDGYTRVRLLWGGSLLLFAWPLLVGLVRERTKRAASAIWLAAIGVVGILMANHRSGFVAILLVLPLLLRPKNKVARQLLIILAVGIAAAALLLMFSSLSPGDVFGYSAARLLDFANGNGADRLMRWRLAADTFWLRPFSDITWTQQWYLVDLTRDYAPHNWILQVLVSEGIVGFLFYAGLLTGTTLPSRKWARFDGTVIGLTTYIAFFMVFCLFNTNFYALANQTLLWIALGALVNRVHVLSKQERMSQPNL